MRWVPANLCCLMRSMKTSVICYQMFENKGSKSKNIPLAKPDFIHDRHQQCFQLLCLLCKPDPVYFTSCHLNTRNAAAGPKIVVKVLLKRRHQHHLNFSVPKYTITNQHHLAADHLVWTASAEVGLKKMNMSYISRGSLGPMTLSFAPFRRSGRVTHMLVIGYYPITNTWVTIQ